MAKNKSSTRQEWNTVYESLSPIDADQMRLVVKQRARYRAAALAAQRTFTVIASDTIYMIGGWIDPTGGPRGRLWWLFAFLLYGAWSAALVGAGEWKFAQLASGLLTLFIGFTVAFVIGLLREINRLDRGRLA